MKQRASRKSATSKDRQANVQAISLLAHSAWESGRNKRAFGLFLEAAQLGGWMTQHMVGFCYDVGMGTKKNTTKALFWYLRAWRADHQTDTCINIAQLYASKRNVRNALFWWNKAVLLGDGEAALDLAKFFLSRKSAGDNKRAHLLLQKVLRSRNVTENGIDEAIKLLKTEQIPAARVRCLRESKPRQ